MSTEKSAGPIRKLRTALGLSQAGLGQLIGRSYQSIQNYERGVPVPPDVIERLKTLAAERGLADIALELSSDEWRVRRVFQPGEIIISTAKKEQPTATDQRAYYHQLLNEVFDSGDPDAIAAVTKNLEVFAKYVRQALPGTLAVPREKTSARRTRR